MQRGAGVEFADVEVAAEDAWGAGAKFAGLGWGYAHHATKWAERHDGRRQRAAD